MCFTLRLRYTLKTNHRKEGQMVTEMTGVMAKKNVDLKNVDLQNIDLNNVDLIDQQKPPAAQPGSPRQNQVKNEDIKRHHLSVASLSDLSDNDVIVDIKYVLGDVDGREGAVTGKNNVAEFDQYDNENSDNDNCNKVNENDPTTGEQSKSSSHYTDNEILYNNDDDNNNNEQTEDHGATDCLSKDVARPKGTISARGNTRGKRTSNGTRKGTTGVNVKNAQTVVDMEEKNCELDNVNDMDDVDVEDMYGDENIVDEANGKTTQE